jgi:hypothetical protein
MRIWLLIALAYPIYIYIYYAADVVDGLIDCKSKSNVKSIYFQNIRS